MHPVRLGSYLIDRKIGSGAMGTVFLGKHEQSGQVAAIKVLPPSLARDEGFVLRFNREIEALRSLNHKNIVQFYESGTDDEDTYYFAMEYVEGENLTLRLRRERRIPWQEAISIAIQICAGLKHAHDVGVVHRDLKPSNLLIAADGTVKITDFGVAQVFAAEQLTVTGAVIGTAEFMSPEQVEGRRADKRSDLYSLGAVLYSMVVGQAPFSKGTPAEIMQKQRFGMFDPPRNYVPQLPLWLDEIIRQLLEKNPEKRFPNAYVVSRRLQEVVKKVELRNSDSSDDDSDFSDDAVSSSDAITGVVIPDARQPVISATLVREILKAQAVSDEPDSVFSRVFNNTRVLVAMLILVIGGLIWFWPSRDERVADDASVSSEPERILKMARWLSKTGKGADAKIQLEALHAVIKGDSRHKNVLRQVESLLTKIRNQQPTYQQAFISGALERAAALRNENPEEARKILHGIVLLYAKDQSVSKLVERATEQLAMDSKARDGTNPKASEPASKAEIPAETVPAELQK